MSQKKREVELVSWIWKRQQHPGGLPDLRNWQQKRWDTIYEFKRAFARGWVAFNASQKGIIYEPLLRGRPTDANAPRFRQAAG